jgi:hypothetical protein
VRPNDRGRALSAVDSFHLQLVGFAAKEEATLRRAVRIGMLSNPRLCPKASAIFAVAKGVEGSLKSRMSSKAQKPDRMHSDGLTRLSDPVARAILICEDLPPTLAVSAALAQPARHEQGPSRRCLTVHAMSTPEAGQKWLT